MKWPWKQKYSPPNQEAVHERQSTLSPSSTGPVAIIRDIHGNLQALEAVLKDIKSQGVTEILCLGDIVGYGGNPAECLDIIRSSGFPCVRGNHDSYVIGQGPQPNKFGDFYRACEWTRHQIDEDGRKWLSELPLIHSGRDVEMVHASLHEPEQWNYLEIYSSSHFVNQTKDICLVGHTHQARMWIEGIERPLEGEGIESIRQGVKQVVNVGSVGQPRDENPKACYALFRRDKRDIWWRRVSYDIEGAQRAIIAAGLPAKYAARLEFGQ